MWQVISLKGRKNSKHTKNGRRRGWGACGVPRAFFPMGWPKRRGDNDDAEQAAKAVIFPLDEIPRSKATLGETSSRRPTERDVVRHICQCFVKKGAKKALPRTQIVAMVLYIVSSVSVCTGISAMATLLAFLGIDGEAFIPTAVNSIAGYFIVMGLGDLCVVGSTWSDGLARADIHCCGMKRRRSESAGVALVVWTWILLLLLIIFCLAAVIVLTVLLVRGRRVPPVGTTASVI